MKRLLIISLLIQTQVFGQNGLSTIRFGFNRSNTNVSTARYSYEYDYTTSPHTASFSNIREMDFNSNSIQFNSDHYAPNGYAAFGLGYRMFGKVDPYEDAKATNSDYFRLRLAFGPDINDVVSFLFGGQLNYYSMNVRWPKSPYMIVSGTEGGSNQEGVYFLDYSNAFGKGFGTHILFNLEDIVRLRLSGMYDWLKYRGIPGDKFYSDLQYTGNALATEASLMFCFGDEKVFGIGLDFGWNTRTVQMSYQEDTYRAEYIPDNTIKSWYFGISLFAGQTLF